MQRAMRVAAVVAGSAAALAGAVTLFGGGGARPGAARPPGRVEGQRVDLTFPAPQAPPGHQLLNLKLRNGNAFHATVCVDNSIAGQVCTEDFGRLSASTNAELTNVDVDPTANAAQLTVRASGLEHPESVPVSPGTVTTHCFYVVSAREFSEVPGCKGF